MQLTTHTSGNTTILVIEDPDFYNAIGCLFLPNSRVKLSEDQLRTGIAKVLGFGGIIHTEDGTYQIEEFLASFGLWYRFEDDTEDRFYFSASMSGVELIP